MLLPGCFATGPSYFCNWKRPETGKIQVRPTGTATPSALPSPPTPSCCPGHSSATVHCISGGDWGHLMAEKEWSARRSSRSAPEGRHEFAVRPWRAASPLRTCCVQELGPRVRRGLEPGVLVPSSDPLWTRTIRQRFCLQAPHDCQAASLR